MIELGSVKTSRRPIIASPRGIALVGHSSGLVLCSRWSEYQDLITSKE
jgi:hypothetical protein